MNKLLSDLFGYEDFSHANLFSESQNLWDPIKNLDLYIENFLGPTREIFIGKDVEIDPSVKIKDKLIIGNNSTIADSVLIRGNCIIGDNVHIGHGVEIKHSIILNNSAVAHLNYVGDAIIGRDVNIGGGVIVANWRFDKKNITLKINDEKLDTGMEKFGALIGDGSRIGVNSAINPGTILGKNSVVYPLVSVYGSHIEGSIIK